MSTDQIKNNPDECQNRYGKHLSTYVSIPEIRTRWEKVVERLTDGRAVLGAIYAPYGYGKTGAALDLWKLCENAGIVAVPPFVCTSLSDILEATHAWVVYKLKGSRPEHIPEIESIYNEVRLRTNEEWVQDIACKQEISEEKARSLLFQLQKSGNLHLDILPSSILRYLRTATDLVVRSGFKGLLIVPDEFKLFIQSSSDRDSNISKLQEFIWGIIDEKRPVGIVLSMPETTYAEIRLKSEDILQRLGAHHINLNLRQVYGAGFPQSLWSQMVKVLKLTTDEAKSIKDEVLMALGQFCPRDELFNGPRSVVATLKRAALKYHETKQPYDILDFVRDYTSGIIVFDGKESSTKGALSFLLSLHKNEGMNTEHAIHLLAAFPDGCPEEVAEAYGVKDELYNVAGKHLGDRVIYQVLGPTLSVYKLGENKDPITDILKIFRRSYNPTDKSIHRAALRGFWNFVLPKILRKRQGSAILGWSGLNEIPTGKMLDFEERQLVGAPSEAYPQRKLNLRVTADESYWDSLLDDSHLSVSILLDPSDQAHFEIDMKKTNVVKIRLAINRVIDSRQIPRDIARLQDIFLPRDVTPLLLLAVADFLDEKILRSDSLGVNEKRLCEYLVKTTFVDRIIRELFGEELREIVDEELPIGTSFFESFLASRFEFLFPNYVPLASTPPQILEKYIQALDNSIEPRLSLAQKRGHLEIKSTKAEIAKKFGYSRHSTFKENVKSLLSSLAEIVEWEGARDDSIASIRLKQHPLELEIIKWLSQCNTGLTVEGKKVHALPLSQVIDQAMELGYLEQEIDYVVRLLVARGYCNIREVKGHKVLHETVYHKTALELQQIYLKFQTDLEKLQAIEAIHLEEVFGDKKWDLKSAIEDLVRREKQNEDICEVLDQIQHEIELLTRYLRNYVAGKVVDLISKRAHVKLQAITSGKNKQLPTILDSSKKSVPATEFSVLLQNLQVQLANLFLQQISNYKSLHKKAQNVLTKYENWKSNKGSNLIDFYIELREEVEVIEQELSKIERQSKHLDDLITNFQRWYEMAQEISSFLVQLLQQKDINNVAQELYSELQKDLVFQIRQHLAVNKLDALNDWEVFQQKLRSLQKQWEQASLERRRTFMTVVENYRECLLNAGISQVKLDPGYDDVNPDVSRNRLIEEIEEILANVKQKASQYLHQARLEILKAQKIYGLNRSNEILELQVLWKEINESISELFSRLTASLVSDFEEFNLWLNELKPLIEPGGKIAQLQDKVADAIHEVNKIPLEPHEEQMLQVIHKFNGNLTEVFVYLLGEHKEYQTIEEILSVVISLYKKGRLNLDGKPIARVG